MFVDLRCLETMARVLLARNNLCLWIHVYFLLLVHLHVGTSFYLPGVAPEDFHKVIPFFFQNVVVSLLHFSCHVHPFFEFRVRSIILSSWFSGMSFLPSFLSFFGFVGLRYKILTLVYNLGNDCNYFGLMPNSNWVCEIRALWYSRYEILANMNLTCPSGNLLYLDLPRD